MTTLDNVRSSFDEFHSTDPLNDIERGLFKDKSFYGIKAGTRRTRMRQSMLSDSKGMLMI